MKVLDPLMKNMQIADVIFQHLVDYLKVFAVEQKKTRYAKLFFSNTHIPLMNLILPIQDDLQAIKKSLSEYDGLPCAYVERSLYPSEISPETFEQMGFSPDNTELFQSMSCDLESYQPQPIKKGITFLPVTQSEHFDRWIEHVAAAFEMSEPMAQQYRAALERYQGNLEMEHFIVQLNGVDVGACSLVISGETAGLYNLAVDKEHRRQGIGSAIQHFRLSRAKDKGLKLAILQASKMAAHLDQEAGFEVRESLTIYNRM